DFINRLSRATCRPGNTSPATSRPGYPGFVAGENGNCCSHVYMVRTEEPSRAARPHGEDSRPMPSARLHGEEPSPAAHPYGEEPSPTAYRSH
ncbi:hypothetical protein Tco_1298824, partial [Tanacetum coccineum]